MFAWTILCLSSKLHHGPFVASAAGDSITNYAGCTSLACAVYVVGPIDISCNDSVVDVQSGVVVQSVNTTVGWGIGPDCPEPSQGLTLHQASPFVMVRNTRNLTLTGGGAIDALGPMWWAESCGNWWCPSWAHNSTPANPYAWRPFLMRIMESTDVDIVRITLLNCGFW